MDSGFIGKYEIVSSLGKGSMGVVYKAQDPEIGRLVAIKTLKAVYLGDDPAGNEALQRFRQESRSAGRLHHPNIVMIFEAGRAESGSPYIVMEYIEGKSLESMLAERGKIEPLEAIHYLSQVAHAMDYAHSEGVIHRDIKPSNIIIDNAFRPHLLDFGVAKMSDTSLTPAGTVVGTPSYMSPEQIRGESLDGRTDIFSLAVVAYEMLTGVRPFPGTDFTTVVSNIIHKEPIPFAELKVQIPPQFEPSLRHGLEKDRGRRFTKATDFISEIARSVGLMIEARGVVGGYDPSKKLPAFEAEAIDDRTVHVTSSTASQLTGADVARAVQESIERSKHPEPAAEVGDATMAVTDPNLVEAIKASIGQGKKLFDEDVKKPTKILDPAAVDSQSQQAKAGGNVKSPPEAKIAADKLSAKQAKESFSVVNNAPNQGKSAAGKLIVLLTMVLVILGGAYFLWDNLFPRSVNTTGGKSGVVSGVVDSETGPTGPDKISKNVGVDTVVMSDGTDTPGGAKKIAPKRPANLSAQFTPEQVAKLTDPELAYLLASPNLDPAGMKTVVEEAGKRTSVDFSEYLFVLSGDPDYKVRIAVLKVLSSNPKYLTGNGLKVIKARIKDKEFLVRGFSAKVLAVSGDASVLPDLEAQLKVEDHEKIRALLQESIDKIRSRK